MSGFFNNLSGFLGIRFNSGGDGIYQPGGCYCNNNFFGNIWGGSYGTMMPFGNTYNPFGFNNFGSMFMPNYGINQCGGYNQFGGYGEFNNYGSQFGAYGQFSGSDCGCNQNNNGFGRFLGYLGVGLLGYVLGKQKK